MRHTPSTSTIELSVLAAAGVLILVVGATFYINRRSKVTYDKRWKEIQKMLADKETWIDAILEADKILDTVLKKLHYKGKTMGERLVAAQHELTANDMVWFSHKLANKIKNDDIKPNKNEVKKSLLGFWRALKDLGAFKGTDDERK